MTPDERWALVDRLFAEALTRAPHDREAFVAGATGDDAELAREVRALLLLHDDAAERLGESVADFAPPLLADLAANPPGEDGLAPPERIGPYRIVREIGRGGMGAVYLAEREGEYRQQVAIKLVKRGMDTAEILDRFRHERQILASLVHPSIAQLHDGGATPEGLPYLVMEYVAGEPLDRYCTERRLGVEARLDLFEQVCGAVQHAHRNLVVHRDIKPSNVIVTEEGSVKLLDFGIAKVLDPGASDEALRTRTEMRLLTPEYAAPEQRAGGRITTGTDVYALGVLLGKLLAGRRPNEERSQDGEAVSTRRPSDVAAALSSAEAALHGTTPSMLSRRLRGDLDAIVLRAAEPDPAVRYGSVQELLDDVRRHRLGVPVLARRGTLGYRTRKFVRRHRGGLAAAGIAIAALIGFAVFYNLRIARERDIARAEAEKAQATTGFLQGLFEAASPFVARGDTLTVYELLAQGESSIDSLAGQPAVHAKLLTTLGEVYRELGAYDRAAPLLERALAVHRSSGSENADHARTLSAAGFLAWAMGDADRSLAQHRAALAVFRRTLPPDDPELVSTMNNVAVASSGTGDYEQSAAMHREILSARRAAGGDSSPDVATTRNNLGMTYTKLGDTASAETELRTALAIRRAVLDSIHPDIAMSLNNLGTVLMKQGRLDEAEPLLGEALRLRRRLLGPEHPSVALTAYNLGALLERRGRFADAEPLLAEAAAIDRARLGADHEEVGVDLLKLGTVQRLGGHCGTAVATLREAERILALHYPPDAPSRAAAAEQLRACTPSAVLPASAR